MTLRQFALPPESIPAATTWYLADLGEARGKQELFTRQSPQRLKVLREHAMIESAVSSNRIEGVQVDPSRIGTVIFGRRHLRDRDEEEVRGYRDALKLIHEQANKLPFCEETIRRLHRVMRTDVGDAGQYKERDNDIIEKFPDGRARVRFRTVSVAQTPAHMAEMIQLTERILRERSVPPLLLLAACNLDFLCIHPFRDGNGRVSRLLLLLQCYHFGLEVGRFISMERLIEQNKERYYETLGQSSENWHKGKHNPWPYINFILYTLLDAYKELESRVGQITAPRGAKTDLVLTAIERLSNPFRISEIQKACPGVSIDLIRRVLKKRRGQKQVECLGRGHQAQWQKTSKWSIG